MSEESTRHPQAIPTYFVPGPPSRSETRSRHRSGPSVATVVALGLSAAVVGVAVYGTARNSQSDPRPPDDADPRFREGGSWQGRFAVAGKAILINRPRAEVYAFWHDLSNQSRFMENVRSIRSEGKRSVWTLAGMLGGDVEIEVDLEDERENERLAWASVPGSQIEMRGHVTFRDAPAGRGTIVELEVEYVPPAGAVGRTFANLIRRSPQQQARYGLKRLKMLLETGEIATSARNKAEQEES